MRVILVILGAFIIVALIGWFYIQTGFYNIAASQEHTGLTREILHETMEHSVRRQAKSIQPPVSLTDAAMLRVGFIHYDAMCATCHGAPGVSRSEIGAGLNPQPPSLVLAAEEWTPSELYWVTKNGIKMSGMPAFGKSHTDNELWAVVAFMLTLPNLEPQQYLAMRKPVSRPDTLAMPHEDPSQPYNGHQH